MKGKHTRSLVGFGGWCFGTSLALLGIAVSMPSGSATARRLDGGAAVFAVSALVLWLFSGIAVLKTLRRQAIEPGYALGLRKASYDLRRALNERDVIATQRFFESCIKDEPPSLQMLLETYRRNSHCLWMIEKSRANSVEIVGAVAIAPLTARGVKGIENRQLRRVEDAQIARDVASGWRRPAAVYIGAIAGKSTGSRMMVIGAARMILENLGRPSVYTRPVTRDGERLAKRLGFSPLQDGSAIWRLDSKTEPPHHIELRDSPEPVQAPKASSAQEF